MKKEEAKTLSKERTKVIIEYITQILSDSKKVTSTMNFSKAKIGNETMCTLDIFVPESDFERHLNLGITFDHHLVLYKEVLDSLLDNFLDSDSVGVTKYFSTSGARYFSGVNAVNLNGSVIGINFNTISPDFMNLVMDYTKRYNEYEESLNNRGNTNIRR